MLALSEVTVVVTRPAKQAEGLCQLIENQGGTAIRFPSLEITKPDQPEKAAAQLRQLDRFDIAIFVSSNAVEWAAQAIGKHLPQHLILVAVGKSTRRALQAQWHRPVLSPDSGSNSEAILALPEMQKVTGRRIIIIRGQGGRELLAEQLTQRGADVCYAEVYQRIRPKGGLSPLLAMASPSLISATSNESLQNLYDMALEDSTTARNWLLNQPLVVISQRTADLAKKLGFKYPTTIASEASNAGLLDAMIRWHSQRLTNH